MRAACLLTTLLLQQCMAVAQPSPQEGQIEQTEANGLPNEDSVRRDAEAENRRLCVVRPSGQGGDDAPAIVDALSKRCRSNSLVFLPGPVYNIRSAMTTEGLQDVRIVQLGRLLWSPDIEYWRSVSMPVGFQNQSTVWYFGGQEVDWDGHGVGTFDGNGQAWYDWAQNRGNLARRPMNINFRGLSDSRVRRLRFVQSQMWTMAVTYSYRVDLDDIYVNSTSSSQWNTLNTDGCDTIYSDSITFRRWFVTNGDDAIALKPNSSNISIYDSVFADGQGVAIGSVGQYNGQYDYISGFYARNITLRNTAHVSYLKTWGGVSRGFPPNGGGGGIGQAEDIVMEDIVIDRLRQQPFFAWQCENYEGHLGEDCNSSTFKLRRFAWRRVSGTVIDQVAETGHFQCSAAAGGCDDVQVSDIDIQKVGGGRLDTWYCENVNAASGFTCNVAQDKRLASSRAGPGPIMST
ncbi:hypothetical protein CDD81_6215 [Ophiocordyceps australis]|uniref:Pectate lyase superfamily protein domain-containing protein n=1 Tax=Ophiocordyceps australis TaxID=1399860 RepID=A0A2C5Y880_9HYPO|nr:hypothetical protein CDD81_6215 [Ophiocordyceps australis]